MSSLSTTSAIPFKSAQSKTKPKEQLLLAEIETDEEKPESPPSKKTSKKTEAKNEALKTTSK